MLQDKRVSYLPFGGEFRQSPQCVTKNLFWVGKNVLALPTMGRRAVVIWTATNRKIIIQTLSPALDLAFV